MDNSGLKAPGSYEYRLTVPAAVIDLNGHVNNAEYVRWMQAAAEAHSDAVGWPAERYQAIQAGWLVQSHRIDYQQPAFVAEELAVYTWVAEFRRVRSRRRYRFVRLQDEVVLAVAETAWVFFDRRSGKPRVIPEDLIAAFAVAPAEGEPSPQSNKDS